MRSGGAFQIVVDAGEKRGRIGEGSAFVTEFDSHLRRSQLALASQWRCKIAFSIYGNALPANAASLAELADLRSILRSIRRSKDAHRLEHL